MSEFGTLLSRYRRNTTDPDKGGHLTQARLAELVSVESGQFIQSQQISYWERGQRDFPKENRELLLALIKVLVACGGIEPLPDADQLVSSIGLQALDQAEIEAIFGFSQRRETPSTPLDKLIANLDQWTGWSSADDHARSSWDGYALHAISTMLDRISWQGVTRFMLFLLTIWLSLSGLVPALRLTELVDAGRRLAVSIRYGFTLATVPLLLTLVFPAPSFVAFELEESADNRNLFTLRLAGSYAGFTSAFLILFAVSIFDVITQQVQFSSETYALLLILPVTISFIASRRISADRFKMYGPKPTLHAVDRLLLFAMVLTGFLSAYLLYGSYDYFKYPVMAAALAILLIVIVYWEQVGKQKRAPMQVLILISIAMFFSIFIGAVGYYVNGSETGQWAFSLVEIGIVATVLFLFAGLFIVFATSMLWHSPTLTVRGTLAFALFVVAPVVGLTYAPLARPILLSLFVVILLVWNGWGRRQFRKYWWIPPSLSLGYGAFFAGFTLMVLRILPLWIIALAYSLVIGLIVFWSHWTKETSR